MFMFMFMKDVLIYVSINFGRVFSLWYHVCGKITECTSAESEHIFV